jgi:RNA polymerase sigma-70 factor (ECF subfamily)
MTDRQRWREIEGIYRADFTRFVRVAWGITGDRESAVDAVQEGFADALRHAEQWSGRGPLGGWVWRCVVNRARKAHAGRASAQPLQVVAVDPAREDELRAQLARLPERQRLVVFLRYFADLEYREIAEALDVRVGTVSATLHAAHAALRDALVEVPA